MLLSPTFRKEEVEREVQNQLAAIKDKQDAPLSMDGVEAHYNIYRFGELRNAVQFFEQQAS